MFVQSDQGVRKPAAEQEFALAPGVSLTISWGFSLPAALESLSIALANNFYPRFQAEADVTDIKRGTYVV